MVVKKCLRTHLQNIFETHQTVREETKRIRYNHSVLACMCVCRKTMSSRPRVNSPFDPDIVPGEENKKTSFVWRSVDGKRI